MAFRLHEDKNMEQALMKEALAMILHDKFENIFL